MEDDAMLKAQYLQVLEDWLLVYEVPYVRQSKH